MKTITITITITITKSITISKFLNHNDYICFFSIHNDSYNFKDNYNNNKILIFRSQLAFSTSQLVSRLLTSETPYRGLTSSSLFRRFWSIIKLKIPLFLRRKFSLGSTFTKILWAIFIALLWVICVCHKELQKKQTMILW